MGKYRVFTEKQVSEAIYKKAPLTEINKNGKHATAKIVIDNKYFGRIKIPNPHNKEFWESKAKNVANDLGLTASEYNLFVKCTMKSSEYLKILNPDK